MKNKSATTSAFFDDITGHDDSDDDDDRGDKNGYYTELKHDAPPENNEEQQEEQEEEKTSTVATTATKRKRKDETENKKTKTKAAAAPKKRKKTISSAVAAATKTITNITTTWEHDDEDNERSETKEEETQEQEDENSFVPEIGKNGTKGSGGLVMHAHFHSSKLLMNILKPIREIMDCVRIKFLEDRIEINTMDGSHCMFVLLKLQASSLRRYELKYDTNIGMNLNVLISILSSIMCDNDRPVILEYYENADEMMVITYTSDRGTDTSRIRLNEIDTQELDIPPLPDVYIIKMKSKDFTKIHKSVCSITGGKKPEPTDFVVFKVSSLDQETDQTLIGVGAAHKFSIYGKCDNIGERSIVLHDKMTNGITIENDTSKDSPVSISLKSRLINFVIVAEPVSNDMEISIHQEFPCCFKYNIKNEMGTLTFYVALMIDE